MRNARTHLLLLAALVVPMPPALSQGLLAESATETTWILPSAARFVLGAGGTQWMTSITVANPSAAGAVVRFKFLGHDADGTAGPETDYAVNAGAVDFFGLALLPLFGIPEGYGAIRITSTTAGLAIQSETWTPGPGSTIGFGGGTLGQTVPALGLPDFATAVPKTLVPIREDDAFRTNLVLANATEIPVTAHLSLFEADGTLIGGRDIDLPPLGMTQINHIASALGAATLFVGRISVSTTTPGGLVAAYASVIDNATNDPRTILPR